MNINHTYQKSMIVIMIILLLGVSIGSSINEKEHTQSNQINQTSSRFQINNFPTSSQDDLSYETVKTNNYQNSDPADIRIEPNQLDLEWPEYGPPPVPPNTSPDPQNPYNVITTKKHQEIEINDHNLPLDIHILDWKGPHGSYQTFKNGREINPFQIKKISGFQGNPTEPLLLIFINSQLAPYITQELNVYNNTLVNHGYSTVLITVSGGDAEDLKNQILAYWNAGYNVTGVVLIGSLPVAWYHHEWDFHGPDEFPCDLFLMDLDGLWLDTDSDGKYDAHTDDTGDTAPEIYIGRIDALDIPGDEIQIIKKYFNKVNDYWTGNISHTNYGLTYTDADWNMSNDIIFGMGYGYDTYEPISYPYVDKDDYLTTRLPDDTYEFIQLACHSWSGGHSFYMGGSAGSNDIRLAPPRALFYNLFCCGAVRFTDSNCLGNAYILNTSSPSLSVIGSTKSGSMLNFKDFYRPIGQSLSFGESFRIWFEDQYPYSDDPSGYSEVSWYYGMTCLGDPTLIPQTSSADNSVHDFITVYNDGNTDLLISDILISYQSGEQTGWLDANPKNCVVTPVHPRYITITVHPQNLTNGTYHSWLHIYSNDPDENPYNIPVTLTVIGKDIAVSVINHPLPQQSTGIHPVDATIKNCGTFTVNNIPVNCTIYETLLGESFESYPYVPPTNWNTVNYGWLDSSFGASHTGKHWAYAWGGDTSPDCWLITKQITVPIQAYLAFWYRIEAKKFPAAFTVAISTSEDPTDITQYVQIWDSGMFDHDEYMEQIINLSAYSGHDIYLGFHHYAASHNSWGLLIDDVSILPYTPINNDNSTVVSLEPGNTTLVEFQPWNFSEKGDYIITVTLPEHDERPWNNNLTTYVKIGNNPPNPPTIDGKTNGAAGTSYSYTFTAFDPENNDVSYYIEWGDGETTEWTAFQTSGLPGYSEGHTWTIEDSYTIRAKAKDIHDAESNWTTLEISMPLNQGTHTKSTLQTTLQMITNTYPILKQILG